MGGFMQGTKYKQHSMNKRKCDAVVGLGVGKSKSITLIKYYEMKSMGQVEAKLHAFLNSALDKGRWLMDVGV
jgi:hypothetical protein